MRRILISFLTALLVACTAQPQPAAPNVPFERQPPPIGQAVDEAFGLDFFGSCAEVLTYLQQHALERVTPWGLDGWGWLEGGNWGADFGRTLLAEAAAPVHSVTNVQEAGVDEPDVIKTDGRIIVALAQGKLHVIDVTGPKARLAGSLALNAPWGSQLFLYKDIALVMSSSFGEGDLLEQGVARWGGMPGTQVIAVDLTDISAPSISGRLTLDGSFVAARLNNATARLVITSGSNQLVFVTPDQFMQQRPEPPILPDPLPEQLANFDPWRIAEAQALAANRQVILNSTVEDWFPRFTYKDEGGFRIVQEGTLAQCDRMARPEVFSGMNITSIVTMNLEDGLRPIDSFGLVSDASTVYASTDSMYVATQQWIDFNRIAPADQPQVVQNAVTDIHRFDLTDPDRTSFAGSGRVPGWLYSQWAMSEHEGRLRVASTTESPWFGWQPGTSQSLVTILEPKDGQLVTAGQIAGLGVGEQIYAVRFIGDAGYVVTFRQTDPLYVLDLRDPTRPAVSGELKIPGYSAYLHPIGNGLLLGVGQDADLNGRVKGTQVSIFNVSDPRDPQRIDKITLPGGYSEAEWDHHAFLYWPNTGLTVIPVQQSDGKNWLAGALAIHVGSNGMTEVGEIKHPSGYLQRSLVVGDHLYTMSDIGIMGNDLETLDEVSWMTF